MAQPNFTPSPKLRFRLSGDNIKKHHELLELREFDRALDFAMLEYQHQLALNTRDANGACEAGYKMKGVQEFVYLLKTLSEEQKVNPVIVPSNLDHRA